MSKIFANPILSSYEIEESKIKNKNANNIFQIVISTLKSIPNETDGIISLLSRLIKELFLVSLRKWR